MLQAARRLHVRVRRHSRRQRRWRRRRGRGRGFLRGLDGDFRLFGLAAVQRAAASTDDPVVEGPFQALRHRVVPVDGVGFAGLALVYAFSFLAFDVGRGGRRPAASASFNRAFCGVPEPAPGANDCAVLEQARARAHRRRADQAGDRQVFVRNKRLVVGGERVVLTQPLIYAQVFVVGDLILLLGVGEVVALGDRLVDDLPSQHPAASEPLADEAAGDQREHRDRRRDTRHLHGEGRERRFLVAAYAGRALSPRSDPFLGDVGADVQKLARRLGDPRRVGHPGLLEQILRQRRALAAKLGQTAGGPAADIAKGRAFACAELNVRLFDAAGELPVSKRLGHSLSPRSSPEDSPSWLSRFLQAWRAGT